MNSRTTDDVTKLITQSLGFGPNDDELKQSLDSNDVEDNAAHPRLFSDCDRREFFAQPSRKNDTGNAKNNQQTPIKNLFGVRSPDLHGISLSPVKEFGAIQPAPECLFKSISGAVLGSNLLRQFAAQNDNASQDDKSLRKPID